MNPDPHAPISRRGRYGALATAAGAIVVLVLLGGWWALPAAIVLFGMGGAYGVAAGRDLPSREQLNAAFLQEPEPPP